MEPVVSRIAGFLVSAGVAAMAAFTVAHIAHNDFGMSRYHIRTEALIGAAVLALLLAIEYFGKKWRKPE